MSVVRGKPKVSVGKAEAKAPVYAFWRACLQFSKQDSSVLLRVPDPLSGQ